MAVDVADISASNDRQTRCETNGAHRIRLAPTTDSRMMRNSIARISPQRIAFLRSTPGSLLAMMVIRIRLSAW